MGTCSSVYPSESIDTIYGIIPNTPKVTSGRPKICSVQMRRIEVQPRTNLPDLRLDNIAYDVPDQDDVRVQEINREIAIYNGLYWAGVMGEIEYKLLVGNCESALRDLSIS